MKAAPALLALLLAAVSAAPAAAQQAFQLTHSINDSAAPSPDGKRLVYISVVEGKEQLFVMNADGSDSVQITRDPVNHEDPAWSPDGRKIAYVSDAGRTDRIWLINPDGSGAEPLTPEGSRVIHPNWAPDSKSLLYCTNDDLAPPRKNDSDIYRIDIATKKATLVITGGTNTYPSLSHDGTRIAFRRMLPENNSEVFVANADGSGARNLTSSPAFDGWPAWSPDDSRIAFASNRGGKGDYQIFVMRPDGSDIRLVADTTGRATAPLWAPDGRLIYFPICRRIDKGADCQVFTAPPPG
jgi:TolB protein